MDEKEKDQELQQEQGQDLELSEFSLEDILKEFGSFEDSGEVSEPEKEDDVRVWDGADTLTNSRQAPAQDTIRLHDITKQVKQMGEVSQETVRFTPVGQEEDEEPSVLPAQEEKVTPFSEEWEPEYEQPIADYIPPQPIVFRPKNRQRELKHKLVEGPEKRYYQLAEKGLGKLQTAIFLSLIVTVLAAGSAALYALGMVSESRIRLLVFGQFLLLLLSALLGSYQLLDGAADMIRKRFSLNSLLLFSFLACCVDAILCLQELRVPCCAAFSLNMTMSLWGAYQKRNTEMAQMDTMRKATYLDSVVKVKDYYEDRPGFLRGEGRVDDFMDTYAAESGLDKTFSVYALIALLLSIGVGVTAAVLHQYNISAAISALSAALLVALPATSFVALSRPMALLERRLHKLGTVLCGWQGVEGLSANGVFPLLDEDIFPGGAVKLNGVKFYGDRNTDEVVAYATALIAHDGGGLSPLFTQLLESRNGYHYDAEDLRGYPGGIGGVVNGEAVLAGTHGFLRSMGVELPEGTRVNQAVYVAIDGDLSGVFAVTCSKAKSAAVGLTTLCAYRGLTPVLLAGDFMLTESFMRGKFGINTRRIAFPTRERRLELLAKGPEEGTPVLALTTKEGLAGVAYAVTGARALRSASIVGTVVHLLGGVLGIAIVLALLIVGAEYLLTPANILLFELIWMIPGLLITEWTRAV